MLLFFAFSASQHRKHWQSKVTDPLSHSKSQIILVEESFKEELFWFCPALPFASYNRYLLTSYFCIPFPYKRKVHLFWVLVLEGLVHLHRTVQLQPSTWDIVLDYCDIEWLALEMNRDHSVIFEISSRYPLTVWITINCGKF